MSDKNGLVVVWTSGDKEVAKNMVFMYTYNSKINNWWDNVKIIVWGSASKLLVNDESLQKELDKLKEAEVEIEACKGCAENLGVVKELEELDVDVYYIGQKLTEHLKDEGKKVLTI